MPGNVPTGWQVLGGVFSSNGIHDSGKPAFRRFLACRQSLARWPIWPRIHDGTSGDDARGAQSIDSNLPKMSAYCNSETRDHVRRCGIVSFLTIVAVCSFVGA